VGARIVLVSFFPTEALALEWMDGIGVSFPMILNPGELTPHIHFKH
jgi:hypothetical protein